MSNKVPYIPGKGPRYPSIVLIGDSPSYDDLRTLEPFSGAIGKFTDVLLHEAGLVRSNIWFTNVVKYFVPPAPKDKKIPFATRVKLAGLNLEECQNELLTELSQLKPNLIIACGKAALFALTGKTDIAAYRGSIMNGCGFKVIPTYHPRDILYSSGEVKGFYNRFVVKLDFQKAKVESASKEIKLPIRDLKIIRSSYELANRLSRFPKIAAIDTEQRDNITVCLGIAPSPKEAIAVPLFDNTIPTIESATKWSLLSNYLSQCSVIGQNFGYDRNKIRPLGFTIGELRDDTLFKAFAINPELPKSQEFLASVYTNEPHYKNEDMYGSSLDNLMIGCCKDVAVSYEINDALEIDGKEMGVLEYYREFLLPLHELYHYSEDFTSIEQFGFGFSEEIRQSIVRKYIERDEQIRYELFKLTGEYINCSSPKQVASLIYDKFKVPQRKGTNEEVLTQLLGNTIKNENQRRVVSLILEERQVKKTLGSYAYSIPDFDGRMRTSYFICLETGRSATQKQEPPTRELLEYRDEDNKLKRSSLGMAFQTITKHGEIGPDVRKFLVADEGHCFLQIDGSQAEARVIFLLAEDYEALKLIDEIDYHALTTTWFFPGSYEDYAKPIVGYEKPERFVGKTLRHAGHLGASKARAALTVNTDARKFKIPITISEYQAGIALETFHNKQPKIRGVFQNEVRYWIEKTRRLSAPVPYGVNAKVGGTRIFFERYGEDLFRMAYSYIPQRSISEMTKGAALRGKKRSKLRNGKYFIQPIVEAHDGLLVQVPESAKEEAAQIMKEEMERPIDFSTCTIKRGELVVPCEVEMGYDYKDLKKFKW